MLKTLGRNASVSFLLLFIFIQTCGATFSSQEPQPIQSFSLTQPLTLRWSYPSELTINLTPATDYNSIYFPLAGGTFLCLKNEDGHLVWKAEMGGEISASPVADERGVYVASEIRRSSSSGLQATGALRFLSKFTGVTLWMRTLPMPVRGSLFLHQEILLGGTSDGRVYAINTKSGNIQWMRQFSFPFNSMPSTSDSQVFIGSEDGSLLCLDLLTGRTLWHYRTRGSVRGRPALAAGLVSFGSADGYVYALSEASGQLRWKMRTGAGVQSVVGTERGILVASLDNFVYFLSSTNGRQLWRRQLAGRPTAEPLATQDGALLTPLSGDVAVVLDLRDGKPVNLLSVGEDNNSTASPVTAGRILFLTTRHGLLAFSSPEQS
ncbi:MAG: hypothetical protein AUG51_25055 [Acidobacteria bacterium 13_1_20CM_3_53_8]|nr:MAG: hypothetical protein AUG51_25055 [Acidobacteria bacterium 13_1_20CM_3_53_8]